MGELFKKETKAIPLHVPADWDVFFLQLAADLGTSRNSVMCMCVKLGGPVLRAHVDRIRAGIRETCAGVASGAVSVSHFLREAEAVPVVVKVSGNGNENQAKRSGRKPGRKP